MSAEVMARPKPLPGHCRSLGRGRLDGAGEREVAMGTAKGGITYSFSQAIILALAMSLAVLTFSRIALWA